METDENGSFSIPVLPGGFTRLELVLSEGVNDKTLRCICCAR